MKSVMKKVVRFGRVLAEFVAYIVSVVLIGYLTKLLMLFLITNCSGVTLSILWTFAFVVGVVSVSYISVVFVERRLFRESE